MGGGGLVRSESLKDMNLSATQVNPLPQSLQSGMREREELKKAVEQTDRLLSRVCELEQENAGLYKEKKEVFVRYQAVSPGFPYVIILLYFIELFSLSLCICASFICIICMALIQNTYMLYHTSYFHNFCFLQLVRNFKRSNYSICLCRA